MVIILRFGYQSEVNLELTPSEEVAWLLDGFPEMQRNRIAEVIKKWHEARYKITDEVIAYIVYGTEASAEGDPEERKRMQNKWWVPQAKGC